MGQTPMGLYLPWRSAVISVLVVPLPLAATNSKRSYFALINARLASRGLVCVGLTDLTTELGAVSKVPSSSRLAARLPMACVQ